MSALDTRGYAGGSSNSPSPHPNSPKPPADFSYAELTAGKRRRVREVLGPAVRAELAEYLAERAAAHVRAA